MEVFRNFDIKISSIKVNVGPNVSLYEITLKPGNKISKVKYLKDDIELGLNCYGIRVIAPIPGKDTVGIEIPNSESSIVSMKSILNSILYQKSEMELPCTIGKTYNNEIIVFDLAQAPNVLVSGTHQGVSMGIRAIISSLLYKKRPDELKIVFIAPQRVEFSSYNSLVNHFLAKNPNDDHDPIITHVTEAIKTLKSLCKLMDIRYKQLNEIGVSNIKEYNKEIKEGNGLSIGRYMPYIVVFIDEYGDLVMTAGKDIELPIIRIAELGSAVGVNLVIADYHLFTRVVNINLKALFPVRMTFKTSSFFTSNVAIGFSGAEKLMGNGDLLFLNGKKGAMPVRVQCAHIDEEEVERINNFIAEQPGFNMPYELPESEI